MPRVTRSPRNSVKDRPAGWRLLLRRQRGLIKPAAWVVFASLIVVLLVVAVRSAVPGAGSGDTVSSLRERIGLATARSGLRVTDIVIEGRANTPETFLHAAIGVNRGDPILGFSLEQARARIETLSWVEHATVERRLPGTVVVSLQERRPFAIWQNQRRYVLVDRAGQIVAGQVVADPDVQRFRHLPLIVGPGAPAAAAPLLDALTDRPALAAKVTASVRVGERRWDLLMANGSNVMLPEGHEAVAMDRLMQLQQDHAVLDRPLAAIDLRLPDRLVLRPKAGLSDPGATDPSSGIDVVPPLPPVDAQPAESQRFGSRPITSPAPTVPVVARKPT